MAATVLISGAGIAGPALAFWLNKRGYRVTIVELADGVRPGGQTVDLRGAGGEVVERMGLLPEMRARSLDQRGAAWIKSDGRRRAEMPVTAFNGNGLVSKLEILRGDLVDVLYQATKVGAYVLAGELGDADFLDANRIRTALQRYEAVMRPYIDRCQDLPNGIDGYLPKSAGDIAVTAQVMKWMQRWPFRSYAERKWFTTAEAIDLPDY